MNDKSKKMYKIIVTILVIVIIIQLISIYFKIQ